MQSKLIKKGRKKTELEFKQGDLAYLCDKGVEVVVLCSGKSEGSDFSGQAVYTTATNGVAGEYDTVWDKRVFKPLPKGFKIELS